MKTKPGRLLWRQPSRRSHCLLKARSATKEPKLKNVYKSKVRDKDERNYPYFGRKDVQTPSNILWILSGRGFNPISKTNSICSAVYVQWLSVFQRTQQNRNLQRFTDFQVLRLKVTLIIKYVDDNQSTMIVTVHRRRYHDRTCKAGSFRSRWRGVTAAHRILLEQPDRAGRQKPRQNLIIGY